MDKRGMLLINGALALTGAIVAAALMMLVTPDGRWGQFIGWVIFFFALQFPPLMFSAVAKNDSMLNCASWLLRFRKRS